MNSADTDQVHQSPTRHLSNTLARVLRELSRDFDRQVTRRLRERGHSDISLSHQVVFANMGLGRSRVTELAESAHITQQAMGKTLRELESSVTSSALSMRRTAVPGPSGSRPGGRNWWRTPSPAPRR